MDTPSRRHLRALAEWTRIVADMLWTHFIHLNPCLPGLDEIAIQRIGHAGGERVVGRLSLPPKSLILFPERSSGGLMHLHGFVAVEESWQAAALEANGEGWLVSRMTGLLVRKYSRTGTLANTPTALVERRDRDPEFASRYALKDAIRQDKVAAAIWM